MTTEVPRLAELPVLVFANGEPAEGTMVQRLLSSVTKPYILAADGGARVAGYYGYSVDCVIGDMDSLEPAEIDQLRAQGALILRHPPEKDETDLELALRWGVAQGGQRFIILGGLGGRLDQLMGNIYLMTLPELTARSVVMVAGDQAMTIWRPGVHQLQGEAGDTLSLIPIGGAAQGIRTRHLKYPLYGETLTVGPARGISNVMLTATAEVAFTGGLLLVVHTLGTA